MHFIAMLGFAVPGESIRYNVPVTILSMVIAVIVVGIGVFIVGFSRAGNGPLLLGGTIIGLGVASMHYTGMAAVRAQAAPGLVVSTADTASATGFLLPLILGLSAVGFIFSAAIALSPTAAEIMEEGELMKRIGQSQAAQSQAAQAPPWQAPPPQPYQPYQPYQAARDEPEPDAPGSLVRPRQPGDQRRPSDQR